MSHNVALKFGANWCAACQAATPAVQEAFARRPDIALQAVDIDHDPLLAFTHHVRAIPALLFFRDGEQIGRVDGPVTPDRLLAELELLYGPPPL